MKNDDAQFRNYTLYMLPLFNNNVSSPEILWIYTTYSSLHIDTLKTTFQLVMEYKGIL